MRKGSELYNSHFIQRVKEYRIKHRCSFREAIDVVSGPLQTPPEMTERTTTQGRVEEMIAGVFRRQPDMSGDQRRRLGPHEYRAVQAIARDIIALLDSSAEGVAAPVSHAIREAI